MAWAWMIFALLGLVVVGLGRFGHMAIARAAGQPTMAATEPMGEDATSRRPVLVELFTSEGCSSCPPADQLLARLDREQFVEGAEAIVLSEHVTYWNQLGWRDPFSSDVFTRRQQNYARQFALDGVYTPQVVVDGRRELVGSDEGALRAAIRKVAKAPATRVEFQQAHWDGSGVDAAVRVYPAGAMPGKHGWALMVALADDEETSQVARGENAGRRLRHVAVARALSEPLTPAFPGAEVGRQLAAPADMRVHLALGDGQPPRRLRVIAFVQDRGTGQVLGSTERMLDR